MNARGMEETQPPQTTRRSPAAAENSPGFKEMAARAPAANATAASCTWLKFFNNRPAIERFLQY
jgi:hypothetical protein